MGKILFIIVSVAFCCFSCVTSASAQSASGKQQSIVGKWKCPKDYLGVMGLPYSYIKGYYKFKKDGTFKAKVVGHYTDGPDGSDKYDRNRSFKLKVSGQYVLSGNAVSTIVKDEDIDCSVDIGEVHPDFDLGTDAPTLSYAFDVTIYEGAVNAAKAQEGLFKEQVARAFRWDKLLYNLSKDTLTIGKRWRFHR